MTLFTSVTDQSLKSRQTRKTVITYLIVSVFCVAIDKIYGIFGHGMQSVSMSLMFLYPLLGGALPFLLLWLLVSRADQVKYYRLSYNLYNSGIAALAVASLLKGIFEIAGGTSSPYRIYFVLCGWIMVFFGAAAYLLNLYRRNKRRKSVNPA